MGSVPEMEFSFVVMTDYLFIYYSVFRDLNRFRSRKTSHKLIPIRLYYHLFRYLSVWKKHPRWCEQTGNAMKMFFVFFLFCFVFFFFLLQSPCISLPCKNNGKCIFLYQTNSYVCACKKIFTGKRCENGKETADKTRLGALVGTTERTPLKV